MPSIGFTLRSIIRLSCAFLLSSLNDEGMSLYTGKKGGKK